MISKGLLAIALALLASPAVEAFTPELVIYTYDSFMAPGGLGPEIVPAFEKKWNCKVRLLPSGNGGQLLNRLQLDAERGKPTAQLVVGIDLAQFEQAKPWLESLEGWAPRGYFQTLAPEVRN